MGKLKRFSGDISPFSVDYLGNERFVFGTEVANNDIDAQINAYFKRGWGVVDATKRPSLQDFNALGYTLSYLLAYVYQQGIAEWSKDANYYVGNLTCENGIIYRSTAVDNKDNRPSTSDSSKWIKTAYTIADIDSMFSALDARFDDKVDKSDTIGTGKVVRLSSLVPGIGDGQTWQDMLGSRAKNTDYTNTTGRPISVSVTIRDTSGTGGPAYAVVDGVNVALVNPTSSNDSSMFFIVPAGAVYSATIGSNSVLLWAELR